MLVSSSTAKILVSPINVGNMSAGLPMRWFERVGSDRGFTWIGHLTSSGADKAGPDFGEKRHIDGMGCERERSCVYNIQMKLTPCGERIVMSFIVLIPFFVF